MQISYQMIHGYATLLQAALLKSLDLEIAGKTPLSSFGSTT